MIWMLNTVERYKDWKLSIMEVEQGEEREVGWRKKRIRRSFLKVVLCHSSPRCGERGVILSAAGLSHMGNYCPVTSAHWG
jgi:hypothetical protein